MASATNQDAYGNPGWGPGASGQSGQGGGSGWGNQSQSAGGNPSSGNPWGGPPWGSSPPRGGPPFWYRAGLSRPAAIAFTVLGFLFWWPVGLALLIYMIGSGRMGCFGRRGRGYQAQGWQNSGSSEGPWGGWKAWACGASERPAASSGNRAFDEYRAETLRRLEEEQKEFGAFLERLRFAKDKAEFDAFMAERRGRPPVPPSPEQPSA
jgi:hypothetical protein